MSYQQTNTENAETLNTQERAEQQEASNQKKKEMKLTNLQFKFLSGKLSNIQNEFILKRRERAQTYDIRKYSDMHSSIQVIKDNRAYIIPENFLKLTSSLMQIENRKISTQMFLTRPLSQQLFENPTQLLKAPNGPKLCHQSNSINLFLSKLEKQTNDYIEHIQMNSEKQPITQQSQILPLVTPQNQTYHRRSQTSGILSRKSIPGMGFGPDASNTNINLPNAAQPGSNQPKGEYVTQIKTLTKFFDSAIGSRRQVDRVLRDQILVLNKETQLNQNHQVIDTPYKYEMKRNTSTAPEVNYFSNDIVKNMINAHTFEVHMKQQSFPLQQKILGNIAASFQNQIHHSRQQSVPVGPVPVNLEITKLRQQFTGQVSFKNLKSQIQDFSFESPYKD